MPNRGKTSSARIPSLDGLRGIAISMVLLGHGAYSLPEFLSPVLPFIGNGSLGVNVFFVLSGYLIYSLSAREIECTGGFNWKQFYLRRAFRIFPAFYLYIVVLLLLTVLGLVELGWPMFVSAGTFSLNYRHLWDVWSVPDSQDYYFIGHYWTLALEEQFYLTWPLLMLLLARRKLLPVLLGVVLLAPVVRVVCYFGMPESRAQIGTMFHTSFDSIAAGVLLAFLLRDGSFKARVERFAERGWIVCCAMAFLVIGSPILTARFKGMYTLPIGKSLELLAICLLLTVAVTQSHTLLFRILNLRWLSYIGVLSYSLYVWNNLFLYHQGKWFVNKFPVNYLCVFGLGLLSYYFVERPFLRLKDRFHAQRERIQ